MPKRKPYEPVSNDNISRAFDVTGLVPERLRGTDEFLDIVTWNIRYFHHYDSNRVERISDILSALNADIIVLQEILDGSLEPVAERLAALGAGHYQVQYGTTGGNQRVALMWDLDWVRTKDDIKELVNKKEVLASDGKDAFPRLPLWANFTSISELEGSDPFDFQIVGIHLKSQRGGGGPQRKAAGNWLAKWLKGDAQSVDSDVIIIGDWNEEPNASSWASLSKLEKEDTVRFRSINSKSHISHLYYKNKSHIGSRLDLAAVSVAAYDEVAGDPEVVRWASLDNFLDTQPKAKEIKNFLKQIRYDISDHMPVITRFYFEEQN
jgi:endonuclease/exonuclease/phosphatase family metal-dependent hydrolase